MTGILNILAGALGRVTDSFFEYVTLLLPGNGTNGAQNNTFLDGSTNNFTITRNGQTTQGTFSPFSQTGWGNYFDGSGDYLTVATNADFNLSTGAFTFDTWVYPTASGAKGIFQGSSAGLIIQISASNKAIVRLYAVADLITSVDSIALNTWTHIAVARSGTTLSMWINGSRTAGGTVTDSSNFAQTGYVIGANETFANQFTGYMSNLRLIKGTAVYDPTQTSIPVPTTPLATGTTNQVFLTCQANRFVDSNTATTAKTITINGNPSVVAFSPFNPTLPWIASINGGSGYFDGSGDYLSVADNVALRFGTGDFTIEFWYNGTVGTLSQYCVSKYTTFTTAMAYVVAILRNDHPTNPRGVLVFVGNTSFLVGSNTIQNNTWYHIAVTRESGSVKVFVNGSQIGSTQTITNDITNTAALRIGASNDSDSYVLGYVSNARFVKGTAVYTGNFTPPTLPVSTSGSASASAYPSTTNVDTTFSSSNTSLLLNYTNAGIYDATSKNDLETVGNAQISTTQSKWGGSSISFDGTGDWLLIPDQPPQRIGTGKFTIELWVYRNSSGTYGLVGKGTGTTGWLVSLNSSNQVVFTYASSTITSTGTVSATTWTHIAVVREGTSTNQTKIYINGTNDGTGTVSTDFNQTNSMYIGADRTGGSAANAYVQDVRITNDARYTANFTAPTAAFPTL